MGDNTNLCMGCMNRKQDSGTCPECGYSDTTPYLPSYLAPRTILVDRYIVGKLLSYNGESADYIAYDTAVNAKITLKEYMPDTLCTRERDNPEIKINPNSVAQYKTFLQEFIELHKALSKMRTLSHISAPHDAFAANNTAYVVYEFVEGVTLRQYLQSFAGELTWDQAKKLFPPIFTTLSLIHNAGIIHRGISPETILVTPKGDLKLTSFGIISSRTANSELAAELYAGYAAPEQYSSSNWHGTWTDVYGISAVLYRTLTGCMPTEAIGRVGSDNLIEPALINRNVPSNVSKVIMSGMKLSTDGRIQTVTELVTKLFEQPSYVDDDEEPARTQTVAKTESREKPQKKQSMMPWLATLTIVLIVVGLGVAAIISAIGDSQKESSSVGMTTDFTSTMKMAASSTATEKTAVTTAGTDNLPYIMENFVGENFDVVKESTGYDGKIKFTPAYDYNDTVAKNIIISQSIPENTFYGPNTELTVKVSKGPQFVEIPDFVGDTREQYLGKLGDLGIKFVDNQIPSTELAAGLVIRIDKTVGEKIDIEAGTILNVYTSTGNPAS